jgi:hypothetical protein
LRKATDFFFFPFLLRNQSQVHPALATLIRDLGLVDSMEDQTFRDKPHLLKALSQLAIAQ